MVVAVVARFGGKLHERDLDGEEIPPAKGNVAMEKKDFGLLRHKIGFVDFVTVDIDENIVTGVVDHAKGRLSNGEVAVLHDEIGVLRHNDIILLLIKERVELIS